MKPTFALPQFLSHTSTLIPGKKKFYMYPVYWFLIIYNVISEIFGKDCSDCHETCWEEYAEAWCFEKMPGIVFSWAQESWTGTAGPRDLLSQSASSFHKGIYKDSPLEKLLLIVTFVKCPWYHQTFRFYLYCFQVACFYLLLLPTTASNLLSVNTIIIRHEWQSKTSNEKKNQSLFSCPEIYLKGLRLMNDDSRVNRQNVLLLDSKIPVRFRRSWWYFSLL